MIYLSTSSVFVAVIAVSVITNDANREMCVDEGFGNHNPCRAYSCV